MGVCLESAIEFLSRHGFASRCTESSGFNSSPHHIWMRTNLDGSRVSDSGALCSILVHRSWLYPLGVGHIVIQVPRLTRRPARAPAEGSMPISFSSSGDRDTRSRGQGVTAGLGPAKTGETHLPMEGILAHYSGVLGVAPRPLGLAAVQQSI